MGKSIISYRNRWFEAPDGALSLLLAVLAKQIEGEFPKATPAPSWVLLIRRLWIDEAHMQASGCLSGYLDALVTSKQRRTRVLRWTRGAIDWFGSFGTSLPREIADELTRTSGSYWTADVRISYAIAVAEAFRALVGGAPHPEVQSVKEPEQLD